MLTKYVLLRSEKDQYRLDKIILSHSVSEVWIDITCCFRSLHGVNNGIGCIGWPEIILIDSLF